MIFCMFQNGMSSANLFDDLSPFSSPQPSGLQRGDSNSSWRPPSQARNQYILIFGPPGSLIICTHLGLFGFGGFLGVMYLYKNSNFFLGGEGWKSLHVVTISNCFANVGRYYKQTSVMLIYIFIRYNFMFPSQK
jgi:hypothetical protein